MRTPGSQPEGSPDQPLQTRNGTRQLSRVAVANLHTNHVRTTGLAVADLCSRPCAATVPESLEFCVLRQLLWPLCVQSYAPLAAPLYWLCFRSESGSSFPMPHTSLHPRNGTSIPPRAAPVSRLCCIPWSALAASLRGLRILVPSFRLGSSPIRPRGRARHSSPLGALGTAATIPVMLFFGS